MYTVDELASRLIAAYDAARTIAPITDEAADFDVAAANAVLAEIERRRRDQGWVPTGRKIAFTNRTIWPRYGVYDPIWAHMWRHMVHHATDGNAAQALAGFAQPRIEPEVVFRLRGPVPDTGNAEEILRHVLWIAAGEIVTSGTVTDAWPVARGETWSSDYGGLDLPGLRLRLT